MGKWHEDGQDFPVLGSSPRMRRHALQSWHAALTPQGPTEAGVETDEEDLLFFSDIVAGSCGDPDL